MFLLLNTSEIKHDTVQHQRLLFIYLSNGDLSNAIRTEILNKVVWKQNVFNNLSFKKN